MESKQEDKPDNHFSDADHAALQRVAKNREHWKWLVDNFKAGADIVRTWTVWAAAAVMLLKWGKEFVIDLFKEATK